MTRSTSRTTAPRVLAAVGFLVSGAVLLTGCASGSTAPAGGAAASSGASGSAQFAQYSDCLKSHGVTLPAGRPGGRPSGGSTARPSGRPSGGAPGGFGGASANPSQAAAMQACASLRPQGQGGFGGAGGGGGASGGTATAAFISCMKDKGVTVTAQQVRALSTSTDPKTVAALKVCKALLPTGAPGGMPTATPSS